MQQGLPWLSRISLIMLNLFWHRSLKSSQIHAGLSGLGFVWLSGAEARRLQKDSFVPECSLSISKLEKIKACVANKNCHLYMIVQDAVHRFEAKNGCSKLLRLIRENLRSHQPA